MSTFDLVPASIALPSPEWRASFVTQTAAAHASGRWTYALLDGTFDESLVTKLKAVPELRWQALYARLPGARPSVLPLSPIVLFLQPESASAWCPLLESTLGRPMLSWICTSESLEQLTDRLLPWCRVQAGGQTLVLRFADTRCLPGLVGVLTPKQHRDLFGPAHRWDYLERDGHTAALALPAPDSEEPHETQALTDAPDPASMVALDESQCARLIRQGEADEIKTWLHAQRAITLPVWSPHRTHEILSMALQAADTAGIEHTAPHRILCLQALALLEPTASAITALCHRQS